MVSSSGSRKGVKYKTYNNPLDQDTEYCLNNNKSLYLPTPDFLPFPLFFFFLGGGICIILPQLLKTKSQGLNWKKLQIRNIGLTQLYLDVCYSNSVFYPTVPMTDPRHRTMVRELKLQITLKSTIFSKISKFNTWMHIHISQISQLRFRSWYVKTTLMWQAWCGSASFEVSSQNDHILNPCPSNIALDVKYVMNFMPQNLPQHW